MGSSSELPPKLADAWNHDFFDETFIEIFRRLGKFDETLNEAQQISTLMDLRPGDSLLDIACGFGRHAGEFHKLSLHVSALDASPILLEQARRVNPGPEYYLADMRKPPPGPFDAVTFLWASFGSTESVEEDAIAFHSWWRVLKPGGRLLIQVSDLERASSENRVDSTDTFTVKRVEINGVIEEARIDWIGRTSVNRYSLGDQTRTCYTRLYSADEIIAMTTNAGFLVEGIYGDFSRKPKSPTDRIVLLARKN